MNTVVIPTDFSPLADNAAAFGVQLAQAIHSEVILTNTYSIPVTMNDMPALLISADGLKKSSEQGLARLKQSLQATHPDVPVKTESRLGDAIDELETLCNDVNPFAVIMGVQNMSGMEEVLFGNSIAAAIRRLKIPVIGVQPDVHFSPPKTIVLATDLLNTNKLPAEKIITFVKTFKASFHIVHIIVDKGIESKQAALTSELTTKLAALQPTYFAIKDEDVVHGLQQYIQQSGADLLMLVPHEHNFFERLFFKLHIKNILAHIPTPVVSIAE